jgi:hypothetical protein
MVLFPAVKDEYLKLIALENRAIDEIIYNKHYLFVFVLCILCGCLLVVCIYYLSIAFC